MPTSEVGAPSAAAVRVLPVAGQVDLLLVRPRSGVTVGVLAAALRRAGLDVRPTPALARAVRVAVPRGSDAAALADRIATGGAVHRLVLGVEPDARVAAERLPDDPLYPEQQDYFAAIHAPAAWELVTGTPAVTVAVIDSGLALAHPDLAPRLAFNPAESPINGSDDDGNGCIDDVVGCSFVSLETADPSCGYVTPPPHPFVEDDEGHGSFVSGIAAAAGNNGDGVAGVAWNVRLLPVKVLDCTATGRIADAAAGIRYAIARGADVINISFGSRSDSDVLRAAVEEAIAAGVVVVASAGNDGADSVTFPAAYPGVIAVAASGRFGAGGIDYAQPAEFSNFGGRVDVFAPGRRLLSTVPHALCGRRGWFCEDGPYAFATGTSFAAPVVAGAAALLRAQHPGLLPALVRSRLIATAAPLGLIDLEAAVSAAFYSAGLPGTSRAGGGAPAGPSANSGAVPAEGPRVPIPANTGGGPGRARPWR